MDDARAFRRLLAARIVGLVGAAALAGCGEAGPASPLHDGGPPDTGLSGTGSAPGTGGAAGTGGAVATGGAVGTGGLTGTGGVTGAGGAGGSGGSGLFSTPPLQACFPLDADAGSCPTNHANVLQRFLQEGCPTGLFPYQINAGPTLKRGQCCYVVVETFCPGGGRPYLVEGRARVSAPAAGTGWTEGARPRLDGLTPEARASLAAAWTGDALLEHASVASFSRLSLALLAAGAPADLVACAHRAALDEIRHARRCFALAGAYAGRDVAPGPFPLGERVPVGSSLAELAVSTVKEGCVGETVAAVLAAEQRARATDPAVRAALEEIAGDEARHAELAWRIAAWAVTAGGIQVREAAGRVLAEAVEEMRGAAGSASAEAVMEAHGRLGAATAAEAVERALAEVVGPAARALFGG